MADDAQSQILAAFKQFSSKPGKELEWESLVHVLTLLGPSYPHKEAKAALQASGKLLDDRITYEDFTDWIFGIEHPLPASYEKVTRYLVDNDELQNDSPGLAFRLSANFEDRAGSDVVAQWNTEVSGAQTGNGFVDVGGLFLPIEVNGITVLKATGKGYALGQCLTCSMLGREPFFCHYRKFVEGSPVRVAQRFSSINEDPVELEVGMRGVILEVDVDGDRRVQFQDIQEPQWCDSPYILKLDALPTKDAHEVEPQDIMHSFKRCDLRGDGLVHLGALRSVLGDDVVEILKEELDTIPDATGNGISQGQVKPAPTAGYVKQHQAPEAVPEPHLFVQYDDLVSWMFDKDVAKAVKCKAGHRMEVNIDPRATCAACSGEGTSHWCKPCCEVLVGGWRVCYACHQRALGKIPAFSGTWLKQTGTTELIDGSKITLSGGGTWDFQLEDENKCIFTTDERSYRGTLIERGMKIKWGDSTIWSRSLSDIYIKDRNKVDAKTVLKNLAIPSCERCAGQASMVWSMSLTSYSESGWKCSNHHNCGSTGSEGRNPWRWTCEKCSWDLCVHCGPVIPVTTEVLRPLYVPSWCEWLTAGPRCLARERGKYYCEVRLGYGMNSPHIGFLTTDFAPKDFDGHGVGTDTNGWAADGLRHQKWHAGCVPVKWARDWKIGDVIGAAIDINQDAFDINQGKIAFSLNGEWNDDAGMVFNSTQRSFYPAVSMNGNWQMHVAKAVWCHAPPDDSYQAFAEDGVFRRPLPGNFRAGDRVYVQCPCQSNSNEAVDLAKGETGTVRSVDEDGDLLIDFDSHASGQWVFVNQFANLLKSDTFSAMSFGDLPSEEELRQDEEAKGGWDNTLVGLWDFVGGSFEIEDKGDGSWYFYDSELTPEPFGGAGWLICTLPTTHISYRMQLNKPSGNVLVWQEMVKGSDIWETTQYATRRGRLADGLAIITTMQASIWSSVSSGIEIGVVPEGVVMYMRGPRQQDLYIDGSPQDGLWMAPLRPRGALECRCIRPYEPMNDDIMEVDTNSPEGRYRRLPTKNLPQSAGESRHDLKYVSMDSIWQALAKHDNGPPAGAVLIKGSWLQGLAESDDGILPRRQDLPAEAIWDPRELQSLVEAHRAEIVAVTYCWLSHDHPDPDGSQLSRLGELVEQRLDCDIIPIDDLGLFVDWCSLHQEPRTTRDTFCFQKGLQSVGLWYVHAQTYNWMLTEVPEGITPFSARGWPTFEHALSDLLTDRCKVIITVNFDEDTCTSWFKTLGICTKATRPPILPQAFRLELARQVFTKESDRAILESMYEATFLEVMSVSQVFKYKGLGWTMKEIAMLADALPYCKAVTTLSLTENCVGSAPGEQPLAAISLAEHLPECPKLRRCLLRACSISDTDITILASCFARCISLVTLNLMGNKIGAEGAEALARVLPDLESLRHLILAGNEIGEVGAKMLGEFAPKCEPLLELWLTGCGDLGRGDQYLKMKWKEAGKAIGDLHF